MKALRIGGPDARTHRVVNERAAGAEAELRKTAADDPDWLVYEGRDQMDDFPTLWELGAGIAWSSYLNVVLGPFRAI